MFRDDSVESVYGCGFSVAELMPLNSVGIVTARDTLAISIDRQALWQKVQDFARLTSADARDKYALGSDVQDWSVAAAQADVRANLSDSHLARIAYRPFDVRWTYFTGVSRGFQCRPRTEIMQHLAGRANLALMTPKQTKDGLGGLVNDGLAGHKAFSGFDITSNFPLYLYPTEAAGQSDAFTPKHRSPNLDPKLYAAICAAAGIDPADQAGPDDDFRAATGDARPSEVKVFDYIYGVLHSPDYRRAYAEFLKIDFPRIPYSSSPEVFRHVSEKGEVLRRLHLMEPTAIGDTPYPFTGEGDDVVAAGFPKWEVGSGTPDQVRGDGGSGQGRVLINKDQGFDGVPSVAWSFPIGGYLPAQKWLKDRRGRALSYDDIGHYQRIVKILVETDRIMRGIVLPLSEEAESGATAPQV